jgi:hypothetical protein
MCLRQHGTSPVSVVRFRAASAKTNNDYEEKVPQHVSCGSKLLIIQAVVRFCSRRAQNRTTANNDMRGIAQIV